MFFDIELYVINYVMLTFSVKTLWMAIYAIVGPNICQVSVYSPEISDHWVTTSNPLRCVSSLSLPRLPLGMLA